MGVAVGLAAAYLICLFITLSIVRRVFEWAEGLLIRLPLVRSVYGAFRELLQFVSCPEDARRLDRQAVTVEIGQTGLECAGFMTRDDFGELTEGLGSEDRGASTSRCAARSAATLPFNICRVLARRIEALERRLFSTERTQPSPR
jgi:uncharacterized membrane protein